VIFRYLGRVFVFAFARSLLVTDRLSFLIGPLITAALWLRGERVDNTAELVATATVATILAVLLLRLIAAPFFVWKEDQMEIAGLKQDLARPERAGAEEMNKLRAQRRVDLAAELLEFQMVCAVDEGDDAYDAYRQKRIMRLAGEVNPPAAFFRLMGTMYETGLKLNKTRSDEALRDKCITVTRALVDYLHGGASEADLLRMEEKHKK
jgi:hypothetical protein